MASGAPIQAKYHTFNQYEINATTKIRTNPVTIWAARVPFVTTMMGVGSVNAANGLNLGFIGSHGFELANSIVHQSDFILAVGTRFTDRSTSRIDEFAPLATVAHIDIDPTSISKNVKADLPFTGVRKPKLRQVRS